MPLTEVRPSEVCKLGNVVARRIDPVESGLQNCISILRNKGNGKCVL